jgi:hypothetical protein
MPSAGNGPAPYPPPQNPAYGSHLRTADSRLRLPLTDGRFPLTAHSHLRRAHPPIRRVVTARGPANGGTPGYPPPRRVPARAPAGPRYYRSTQGYSGYSGGLTTVLQGTPEYPPVGYARARTGRAELVRVDGGGEQLHLRERHARHLHVLARAVSTHGVLGSSPVSTLSAREYSGSTPEYPKSDTRGSCARAVLTGTRAGTRACTRSAPCALTRAALKARAGKPHARKERLTGHLRLRAQRIVLQRVARGAIRGVTRNG